MFFILVSVNGIVFGDGVSAMPSILAMTAASTPRTTDGLPGSWAETAAIASKTRKGTTAILRTARNCKTHFILPR